MIPRVTKTFDENQPREQKGFSTEYSSDHVIKKFKRIKKYKVENRYSPIVKKYFQQNLIK